MAQKYQLAAVSVAANATGLATAQTGAIWTLAANNCGDSLAHFITITNNSVTDHSAKTAVITGTDINGAAQTETIALPAASVAVTSTKYFKTVTSVVPSATIGADTMGIGWSANSITAAIPMMLDLWVHQNFQLAFGCAVDSGSPTFSVQQTYDGLKWFNHAVVSGKTVSTFGENLSPVLQLRLNFTAAGGVSFAGLQA